MKVPIDWLVKVDIRTMAPARRQAKRLGVEVTPVRDWTAGTRPDPTGPARAKLVTKLAGQLVIAAPDADVADDETRKEPSKRFQNVTISCKERRPLTSIPPMATVEQS